MWAGSNAGHGPLMTLDASGDFAVRTSNQQDTFAFSAANKTVNIMDGAIYADNTSNTMSLLGGAATLSSNDVVVLQDALVVTSNTVSLLSNSSVFTPETASLLSNSTFISKEIVEMLDGTFTLSNDSATLLSNALVLSSNSFHILDDRLTVDSNDMYFDGRIGIGMRCTGQEGVATYEPLAGWEEAPADVVDTKLAVDGNIYTTGTLISLSDPREKRDIRIIEDALDRIKQMNGYTYEMNANATNGRRHVGLLASEVERAMPEAVYTVPTPPSSLLKQETSTVSSVAYGNLVGLLASAVNQLHDRIIDIEKHMRLYMHT